MANPQGLKAATIPAVKARVTWYLTAGLSRWPTGMWRRAPGGSDGG